MPAIATLTPFTEPILSSSAFTTGPWELWGLQIPGYGSPPTYAQFEVEVLQPPAIDGNRYRLGGAHFPEFQLLGIIPAIDFPTAGLVAREIERLRGLQVTFQYTRTGASAYNFYVKSAQGLANAKRIIGATANGQSQDAGPAPSTTAGASVDISLVLQYYAP